MMNLLGNHCQKHILSPVWHDQNPETYLSRILGPPQVMISTPQSPPGLYTLKGPIPSILVVHFTSYNQKPMIPRTHFHCITTWVARSSG